MSDSDNEFSATVTDGVFAVLRAAVEATDGPGAALAAVTVALAALQQHAQRYGGPKAIEYIERINAGAIALPAGLGVRAVNDAIREVCAPAEEAPPTRFYGVA